MSTAMQEPISSELAQRKVSQFVIIAIGDRLYGGEPRRTYDDDTERMYWSVPVMVRLPTGDEVFVGEILVDPHTGQLRISEEKVDDIIANAKLIAKHHSGKSKSSTPKFAEHNAS